MTTESSSTNDKIVERLSFAAITEQRRARRWKIFFTILLFIYFTPLFLLGLDANGIDWLSAGEELTEGHTAVVKLEGVIASSEDANAEAIIKGLDNAFKNKHTKGVILAINSPGGSPVQSADIYDEMVRLQKKYPEIPLYVVVSDMAASGGYFVASAAKNIYVNKSSIVGSIGVRMDGFGAVDLIKKLGVERRTLTAGKNKALLDPFLPENEQQKEHLQSLLNDVHQHFIQAVKAGRGDRLKESEGLFSGLIWTGEKAIQMGLADGYGSVNSVARDIIKAKKVVDFTPEELLFDRLATKISLALADQLKFLLMDKVQLQ